MTVVVDASVALKLLFAEDGSDAAEALLSQPLIAPWLFGLECANAVIKRLRRREIDHDQAGFLLEEVRALPVRLYPASHASDVEAVRLALAIRHPVHDCAYLALARAEGLQVVTADRRFQEAASTAGYGAGVRLLAQP